MSKPTTLYRVYDPNSLNAMGMAFDVALEALPCKRRSDARTRRELLADHLFG